MRAVFLRVLDAEDKPTALLSAIHAPEASIGTRRFEVDPVRFGSVARSPFAYWVSERLRAIFSKGALFESADRTALGGMKTQEDERFVRVSWEVVLGASESSAWVPLCRGGGYAPFYSDVNTLTDWWHNGKRPRAAYEHRAATASWGGFGRNEAFYFREGLSWPLRGAVFSAQAIPSGCIFSVAGKMAFTPRADLLCYLALFNSLPFDYLVRTFAGKVGGAQYEAGLIQRVAVPRFTDSATKELGRAAHHGWSLRRSMDTRTEVSHAFVLPVLLQTDGSTLVQRTSAWGHRVAHAETALAAVQAQITASCFQLYGVVDESDRQAILESLRIRDAGDENDAVEGESDDGADADSDHEDADDGTIGLARDLVSWAVGIAFGRFDVRLATGARPMPPEPEPFDPLPACSPGMLTGDDGLPLAQPPAGYPLSFPESGVLVDDPGHALDLTAAVRAVFDVVFGADADRWWSDVAALLEPKSHDLRVWLASAFFEHHLKRYSKSRRKAPIVWQLGTPSGRYNVWLYAHRLTSDSLLLVQNELLAQKLALEERKLGGLTGESARERTERGQQQDFVDELRAMRDELGRVAPLFQPTLDDGIVLVKAPLWRLVRHKPWQKELQSKWTELAAGKYDWAHTAMHLWPERVVPKCADDRSLAIAHGLEDVFWVEGGDGKWKKRAAPTRSVAELVAERSSAAVKAALMGLSEAPSGGAARKKSTKGR